MTKDGKFKRSVRAEARDSGLSYTEALAERQEAEPPAETAAAGGRPSPEAGQRAQFVSLVQGTSDEELDALAEQLGGYREFIDRVLEGFVALVGDVADGAVGFDLDVGQWRVATQGGTTTLGGRVDATDAVMQMSAPDFLRFMAGDLSLDDAARGGRVKIRGDAGVATRLFSSVPKAAPQEARRSSPMLRPPQDALRQVASRVAPGSSVGAVRVVEGSGGSAWEVVLEHRGRKLPIVVTRRNGKNAAANTHREFEQFRVLHDRGLPVPEPLLLDEGELFGMPTLVTTKVPGRVQLMPSDPVAWARGFGQLIAAVHRVDPNDVPALAPSGEGQPLITGHQVTRKHQRGERIWELAVAHPPTRTPPGLIHGNLQATSVLWNRGKVSGLVDWQHPFVGSVAIDLAEARIGALLVFGPEIAERLRIEYEAARGEPVAEMDKWDLKAVITFGIGVGIDYWLPHYKGMGRSDLTRALLEQRLDEWIGGILERANDWGPPQQKADAAAAADDGYAVLRDAVAGSTDAEIRAFADQLGGFSGLCAMVFDGMRARREREQVADFDVAFVLDDSLVWHLQARDGKVTATEHVQHAAAFVRCRPADFLRLVVAELDVNAAIADGRLVIEGDRSQVAAALPSARTS